MASVQWGATNTARLVFTPVSSAVGALSAAAGSLAILWKPVTGSDGFGLVSASIANWYHFLERTGTNLWSDDDGLIGPTNVTTNTSGNWFVTVVTWPSGAAAPDRFHWIDLTAAGSWNHENSANNGGTRAGPGTTGWMTAGSAADNNVSSGTQMALIGAWNVQLSDAQCAALTTGRKTSDWYNNTGGTPIFLSELTSLTPTDLLGSAFSSGNSTTTNLTVGGDPDGGWTFDGIGSVPVFYPYSNVRARMKARRS